MVGDARSSAIRVALFWLLIVGAMVALRVWESDGVEDKLWCSHFTLDRGEVLELRASEEAIARACHDLAGAFHRGFRDEADRWTWKMGLAPFDRRYACDGTVRSPDLSALRRERKLPVLVGAVGFDARTRFDQA